MVHDPDMLARFSRVLIFASVSTTVSCASQAPAGGNKAKERIERTGRGNIMPADILRSAAAGADRLELASFPWDRIGFVDAQKETTMLVVADRRSIDELLTVIQAPRLAIAYFGAQNCYGAPQIRLFHGEQLLVEFSFHSGRAIWPLSDNLWGSEDVSVTRKSALAIAAWFEGHGYSGYRKDVERYMKACAADARCAPWW